MEAFAFLNASKKSDHSCGSIEELQNRLRDVFSTKVTEKRADHITVKLELRANTVFHVPVTETENETLENAANLDPLLGGSRSSVAPAPNTPGAGAGANLATRQINAIDALMNQPSDDHALQKSVAKHIMSSLGEVDGSNWTVRQVSRGEQGWTFTYICRDSYQAWTRQHSKDPKRAVVGESSSKDSQDPVNMSRPAFDCRGSVTVAFVKSTRTIDVKYEHTPIHKSVAELVDLLVSQLPPPVPVRPPASAKKANKPPKEPKEPRAPRPPKDPNAPKSAKKRRRTEEGAPGGENATPKKRKKKKDSTANGDMNGSVIPPEMPGALPVGESAERSLYNTGEIDGSGQNGYGAYPEGLVGAENGSESRADSQGASSNGGVHSHSILNLPPGEAARRRDVAIKLLTERDIDPSTLSPEQFNIFANQSPDLQRESLAMLVKYGAERLRIVHPTKDGASSGQSTPQGDSGASNPATATPPDPSSPSKKKTRKKKAATPEEAAAGLASDAGTADARKRPTRGACESCRSFKTKCDKAKPSCSQCLASGITCFYPLAKPRASRVSQAAAVEEEEEAEPPQAPQAPAPQAMDIDDEPEDLGSPGFHDPAPEPSTMISPAPDPPAASTYPQPSGGYDSHSGFLFPDSVGHDVHSGISGTSLDYLSNAATDTSLHNYTYPTPVQQTPVPVPEPPVPAVQPEPEPPAMSTRTKSRRSLPSAPMSQTSSANNNHNVTGQATSWQTASQTADITPANRRSPRQSRTRKPFQNQSQNFSSQNQNQPSTHNTVSPAYDDLRQQSSGWPAVTQSTTPIPLPATAQQMTSPYQTAAQPARAKSRQSNRAQTQTPVQNMSTARPAQTQVSKPLTDNSGYGHAPTTGDTSTTSGYDNYSQYQNTRADSTNNRVATYDQYTTNPTSAMSNSYSSYDSYNTRPSNNTTSSVLQNPVPQANTTSYNTQPAAPTSNTSHWGSNTGSSSLSQPRNTQSYNTTSNTQPSSTARSSSSYLAAPATNQQQSQVLQGFSVRPQPLAAPSTRSSSANTYNQQPQQQQQQSTSQRQSYNNNSYSNQTHGTSNSANTQQQQQQQQNWYGFTAANNASSNYNANTQQQHNSSAGAGAGGYGTNTSHSHSHGGHGGGSSSYGQQAHHRSMNLSSHTYSSIDGGEHAALFEMLRNNPSG
ncbi:hypothetical protein V8F20_002534 [Naviculisporaceae sp. PSN 640]